MRLPFLLVDDSFKRRSELAAAFEAMGRTVETATSLAEARARIHQARWSGVVAELDLPDGDGAELVRAVRERAEERRVFCVFVSERAGLPERRRVLAADADDVVSRPFSPPLLAARLMSLVERPGRLPSPSAHKVLLVSDRAHGVATVEEALATAGYDVRCASSVDDALRIAAVERPDGLVVKDGPLDAAALVVRIRLDGALRHLPCVLLTSPDDPGASLRALESGADARVNADGDPEVLLARLRSLIRARSPDPAASSLYGPKRLLVVGGDLPRSDEVRRELLPIAYDVVVAEDVKEAVALVGLQRVDGVVASEAACRALRAVPAVGAVPLFALVRSDRRRDVLAALEKGADDALPRSAPGELLRAQVRALLRRHLLDEELDRRVEEDHLREIDAAEARLHQQLAEHRAQLLSDLERKNAELVQARAEAERQSQFKSRFLASMSHELRTPLNAILGFAELLQQGVVGPLGDKQRDYVNHILVGARDLLALVNDILDLSKIDAGRMELSCSFVALPVVVEAVIGVIQPIADRSGVALETDLDPELPPIWADPMRLKQVLYNLLSNGIKFTPRGGKVRISARRAGPNLRLDVSDNGVGISEDDIPRLFREFEQLLPITSDRPAGTGLGLALTQRLVRLHGGDVTVESRVGQGSTFTVTLPIVRRAQPANFFAERQREGAEPRVLVVEEDSVAAERVAEHLHAVGFRVVFAREPREVKHRLETLRPALILLNPLIGGGDGWRIMERLRAAVGMETTPIVALTFAPDRNRGFLLGVDEFVSDSAPVAAVLAALERVGAPRRRLSDLRLLAVGAGGRVFENTVAELMAAGSRITRTIALGSAIDFPRLDVILVEIASTLASGSAALVDGLTAARAAAVPVIATIDAERIRQVRGWREDFLQVAARDPLRPDHLIRSVKQALGGALFGGSRADARTGLPSAEALDEVLERACERAAREGRRVALFEARLRGSFEAAPAVCVGKLRARIRPGDFLAVTRDGHVALVVYDPSDAAIPAIADRFASLLREVLGIEVAAVHTRLLPAAEGRADSLTRAEG